MSDGTYERLARAMERLPNGFARTPSGVEMLLLERMYSPEEARVACELGVEPQSPDEIAGRAGVDADEAAALLQEMAGRGAVRPVGSEGGETAYRLAPFRGQPRGDMDHQFVHMYEEYLAEGGAAASMAPRPATFRVLPATSAVKTERIVPHEDARRYLLEAKSFRVVDCICRVRQRHIGNPCRFPERVCLFLTTAERPPTPDDITRDEALAILDRAEEIGLVHTCFNHAAGIGVICNCCDCCCVPLRAITSWGIEGSPAHSSYYAVIDAEECTGCGTCIGRCLVGALHDHDGVTAVDRERCIGCGVCVTGCPNDVARLQRKPDEEIVQPPADLAEWGRLRLANRGLVE